MRSRYFVLLIVTFTFFSCRKYSGTDYQTPPPPPPPANPVLLKDVVVSRLPSPYYHFEYDAQGKVSFVSFASEFTRYNVIYSQGRISELRNDILVNHDRLVYTYDNEGRVILVTYVRDNGEVFSRVHLNYAGNKLIDLSRERKLGADFVLDKAMSMTYHADGNLLDVTYHYFPVNGQPESIFTSRFENYDTNINVDGFDLIHNEFFDHLVFLPGVQLQKNNPAKETRTGDGVNYKIDFTYTFNSKNEPLIKSGQFIYTNGDQAGQIFQTESVFSYY